MTSATLTEPSLSLDALRRVVVSLILSEQKKRNKKGLIRQDQTLSSLICDLSPAEIDAVAITEETLGFDSIGVLELILAVNRFFDLSRTGVEDYLLVRRRVGDWTDLISQHRDAVGEAWSFGFETSGSTGESKLVQHSASALWAEIRAQTAGPFKHIRAPGRIILLVPPHHIYGFLFGCILPEYLGQDVIDLHNLAPFAAFRNARAGDLIVATPFHWEMLRKTEQRFHDGVFGVTSAAPASDGTWEVTEANNLQLLTEVYGATETAGIGCRSDQHAPFELLSHLVMDAKGNVRRSDGTQVVLQDRVEWSSPDRFHVLGRRDHVIQIAGVNVSPDHVKNQILQLEGVADVSVRPGKERLRAFVVPKPGVDAAMLERDLQAHILARLDAPARPASITFGSQIPVSEMGKLADWA